jgi:hypothetical protein
MLNIVSILIGIFALLSAAFAFIPLLGWMNWIVIPIAIVGLGVGPGLRPQERDQSQHRRDHHLRAPPDARRRIF